MGGRDQDSGNPFWDFSLSVYDRSDVAAACLALQDRRGVDVNMMLCCAWAGGRGQTLSAADLARLITVARPWQTEVVAPLRAVRRHLKAAAPEFAPESAPGPAIDQLRARLKDAELAAEAVEQRMLFDALAGTAARGTPAVAGANMVAYLEILDITPDATDVAGLAAILRGCYPDLPPLQAVWAVTG